MANAFGELVREWRGVRRMSQLDLAHAAALSSRHLSFLESGRAAPSRPMVLRLAEALAMPRPVANLALGAAGFAPAYPSAPPDAPDLVWARRAIDSLLTNHAPFPGLAVDRHWNVVAANAGAQRLLGALGFSVGADNAGAFNMVELLIGLGKSDVVTNWEEMAALAVARLRAEIAHLGGDPVLSAFAERLAGHPRLAGARPVAGDRMILPMRIVAGTAQISLLTTIAQFGSAQEIALSELKIELMFPADEATQVWFSADA